MRPNLPALVCLLLLACSADGPAGTASVGADVDEDSALVADDTGSDSPQSADAPDDRAEQDVGLGDARPEDVAPDSSDDGDVQDDVSPEDTPTDVPPDDALDDAPDGPPEDVHPDTSADGSTDTPRDSDAPDARPDAPAPACGDGVLHPARGEECDDGNTDDGDECSSTCRHSYACPGLPMSCAGAAPSTTEHHMVLATSCGFSLVPWSDARIAARRELIAALVERSGGRASLGDVMGDLNRDGSEGITSQSATRMRNHAWRGFMWNAGDMGVSYWYPQGITGTSDAYASGRLGGRNALMVSWYHNTDERPTKGARISLVDITSLESDDVSYRHLLLVEPSGTPTSPNFGPVESPSGSALHAGGIVWWGDLLYVADTTGGLRVFDLRNIMRAEDFDTERVGISGSRFDGHGYGYVVPELMRYELADASCPLRFSFVSLDRSSAPPALITGEYRSSDIGGRVAAWNVDPATGLLDTRSGEVRATAALVSGQTKMQGAARYEGNYYFSSSSQTSGFGRLYRTRPGFGESSITAWVHGCEDLYIERDRDFIWTAAEFPDLRDVIGIPIRRP